MLMKCKEFDKLWDIYYKFKSQVDANPEPCCIDECCEGFGNCGEDCCNEDGNKPMGTCWCHEESKDYEPPNEKLLKDCEDANKKLTEHRDNSGCIICAKNKEAKI